MKARSMRDPESRLAAYPKGDIIQAASEGIMPDLEQMRVVAAVATGSSGERPLGNYTHDELVTLTIELSARHMVWRTDCLFERVQECRAELLKRLCSNGRHEP